MEERSTNYKLSRIVRTAASEVYVIWDTTDTRIGQLHLHYAHDTIHAAILLELELSLGEEEELLETIDSDIVSSYLPCFDREDFIVTVFRAEELSSFSYSPNDIDALGSDEEE